MVNAKPKRTIATTPGLIEPDPIYGLDELQARLGIGVWGLRQMRRAGLPVYRIAGRSFFLGRDVIDFIVQNGLNDRATDPGSAGQEDHRSE